MGEMKLAAGTKVLLVNQGDKVYTVRSHEYHQSLLFYRLNEIVGGLFLRPSLRPVSDTQAAIPEDLIEHYELCGKYESAHLILCRQLIERIAHLQQELEAAKERNGALDWQPITPDNLPKVGDEVAWFNPPYVSPVAPVYGEDAKNTHRDWKADGWTHFRPIGAPDAEK